MDISSSSVKVLELSRSEAGYKIGPYGCETLPIAALDGHFIKDIDLVSACIKRLISKLDLTSKDVVLAVPDSAVISKIVQLSDSLSETDLEEWVMIEADKYIPYPIDEVNLDFEVLGPAEKSPGMQDVLIVASRSENVYSRSQAVSRAGLVPKIVDVESYAVERAVRQMASQLLLKKNYILAVIDIGMHYTHLFVLNEKQILFCREEQFGQMQLLEAIAEHYQISLDEAQKFWNNRQFPAHFDSEILNPFKELLLLQVKRTLQFFYSTTEHAYVDHILLAGSLVASLKLKDLIQEQLTIKTSIANPFINLSREETRISDIAPEFLISCGLALRHVSSI